MATMGQVSNMARTTHAYGIDCSGTSQCHDAVRAIKLGKKKKLSTPRFRLARFESKGTGAARQAILTGHSPLARASTCWMARASDTTVLGTSLTGVHNFIASTFQPIIF